MAQMRLINLFPSWITDGLFARLGDWTPWDDSAEVDKNALDIAYFGNRSGDAPVSPLLEKMVNTAEGPILSDTEVARIDGILRVMYGKSWHRIWEALELNYNPIDNYNMEEVTTYGKSIASTETGTSDATFTYGKETKLAHAENATDSITHGKKETTNTGISSNVSTTSTNTEDTTVEAEANTKETRSDTSTDSIAPINAAGFTNVQRTSSEGETESLSANNNSETSTTRTSGIVSDVTTSADFDDNKTETQSSGTDTSTRSRDPEDNYSLETQSGSDTNDKNHAIFVDESTSGSDRLTRKGNIGVTTSQQMITSELALRRNHFFEIVFMDLDAVLTGSCTRIRTKEDMCNGLL